MGLARLQKNPIQRLHLEAIWHHTVASLSLPQYEIKSDKTDHVAAHRGKVLTKLSK